MPVKPPDHDTTDAPHEEKYHMPKNANSRNNSSTKPRFLRGKTGPVSLVLATKAVTLAAVLGLYYVIVLFSAVQVVPLVMGFVKSGTGVTLDMPIETVLSVWVVPALFLVALVYALVIVTIRSLWRLRKRTINRVALWALGSAADAMPLDTKSIRKQNHTTTKAA